MKHNSKTIEIQKQYAQPNLYENIIDNLILNGIKLNEVTRTDLSGVDEFHIRGLEVSHELALQSDLKNKKLLDIGCGLGGPCRMLSDLYNCQAYGIDLNSDYIKTAKQLSDLIQMKNSPLYFEGDALNLPFEDGFFDVVWTQHVQMNIEDKNKFYSEINRVLAKNGILLYYDIFKHDPIEINYPVPWADNSSISYLQTIEEMDSILKNLKFLKKETTDQSDSGLEFLENAMEAHKFSDSNQIGLNLLLGQDTETKFNNVLNALQSGKIELQSGVYQKKQTEDLE